MAAPAAVYINGGVIVMTTPVSSSPASTSNYGPVASGSVFALPDPPSTPPTWHLQYASSPRRDLITSVAQRVSSLFVSGLAGRLLTNANVQNNHHRGFRHPTYKAPTSNDDEQDSSTPSKKIDNYLKRRGVYELLEINLVVGGFVCNKSPQGIHIQIEKIFKIEEISQTMKRPTKIVETVFDDLKELQIEGLCPIGELTESSNHDFSPSELLDQIPLGSPVKALVISVDSLTDVIYFSLNSSRLSSQQLHHHPLGVLSAGNDSTIPPASPFHHWRKSTWYNHPSQPIQERSSSKSPLLHSFSTTVLAVPTFVERLKDHPLFKNPQGMTIMSKAFEIAEYGSLIPFYPCDSADMHYNLRAAQNITWAQKSVSRGLEYLRQDRLSDALQYFSHAINVEPQFTDAYVHRGVAYLRLNQTDPAMKDLQHALDLEPNHSEALLHLQTAQEKKQSASTKVISDNDEDSSERRRQKRKREETE